MVSNPQVPQIDRRRPECVALDNRIKQRRTSLARFRQQLQETTNLEERVEILRNIDKLSEEIDALVEELGFEGCYIIPVPQRGFFLKVIGIEATQSTQYFALEGSGAGANNSVRFIEKKQMMARVYVRNDFPDFVQVTGRLTMYDFNNNTLKYDILRKQFAPTMSLNRPDSSSSTRRDLNASLNFIVPASDCYGKVRLDVLIWAVGHEGDPIYEGEGVYAPIEFITTRRPTIQCFRVQVTIPNPAPAPPNVISAPTFADCVATMAFAQRLFPISGMSIIDRGTLGYTGPLTTAADYAAVRQLIQDQRDAATPAPPDYDIYVGMVGDPGTPTVWGNASSGCLQAVDGFANLFAHELGHLLLPGDDHVSDTTCPLNPGIDLLDPNYPNYDNTNQSSGIGEFGVDLGAVPMTLYTPDSADIMSYCTARWISPYNYNRAMVANVLNPSFVGREERVLITHAQKLLITVRLHRDGRVELVKGMHLPGEPRPFPPKSPSGIFIELHGPNGELLASTEFSHRNPDRPRVPLYEDLQEVMPWSDQAKHIVVVREGREVARWEIEEPPRERLASGLSVRRDARDGSEPVLSVSWQASTRESVTYSLRFTPDGGATWLGVASRIPGTEIEVDETGLPPGASCHFQLLISTGIRTVAEGSEVFSVPPRPRQMSILEPKPGTELTYGEPMMLTGAAASLFGEEGQIDAFWSSNRDGFLGDGLSVFVPHLSAGRHVLTLTADDGIGGEVTEQVVMRVRQQPA